MELDKDDRIAAIAPFTYDEEDQQETRTYGGEALHLLVTGSS